MTQSVPPVGAVVDYTHHEKPNKARLVVVHVSTDGRGGDPLLYLAANPIAPLSGEEGKLYHPLNLIYMLHAGWWAGAVSPYNVVDTGERVKVTPFDRTAEYKEWRGCTFDGTHWQRPKTT
jgi:hypothetical protein